MKKRIITIAPSLPMMENAHLCLIMSGDYEPSSELFASEKMSPVKLKTIPEIVRKLEEIKEGNSIAMWNMAVCYDCGISVERNQTAAKDYYMLAYMQDGIDYGLIEDEEKQNDGISVTNFLDTAQAYIEAAQIGCPCAMYFYGMAFLNGLGVREDDAQANLWFRKAGDCGVADALAALANSYFRGYGVEQDLKKAMDLFRAAASAGSAGATLILGQMYWNAGMRDEGLSYIRQAAKLGDARAAEILKQINIGRIK